MASDGGEEMVSRKERRMDEAPIQLIAPDSDPRFLPS